MESKRKNLDTIFTNIPDPNTKKEILGLVKCPKDATNLIFWTKRNEPIWGLTIKSIPKKNKNSEPSSVEMFPSQHTWKVTWFCKEDSQSLQVAKNSESLSENIEGENFESIKKIYNLYIADKKSG